ncbi:MAG: hypothetical protein ACHQ1H_13675, partial [Nitrososphaerales archaeon]
MFQQINSQSKLWIRVIIASALVAAPPVTFEKLTYYYYAIASPAFFSLSGERFWFDIAWFCVAGAIAALIVGRNSKAVIIPPLIGSLIFTIEVYVYPFCVMKECYLGPADGLGPVRDFLLFASLSVITSAALMKRWSGPKRTTLDVSFQLGVTALVGFALSFFPVMHIFAGVSAHYPVNYIQWFLAGAPAGLAGSMWMLDRGTIPGAGSKLFAGLAGVVLAIGLGVEIPCEDCGGYPISISSIVLLAAIFCIPAIVLEMRKRRSEKIPSKLSTKTPTIITTVTIVVTIILLLGLQLTGNYQMSVTNIYPGVSNSAFS